MALPLTFSISAAARRALPIIERGVREGLSGTAINNIIREAYGTGIRRQTMFDIIREISGIERASQQLRFVNPTKRPNFNRLPTALTKIRRKYSFVVQITGELLSTGESIIQNITVSTDSLLTRGEIESQAEDVVLNNQPQYGIAVLGSLLVKGVRAGSAGTL